MHGLSERMSIYSSMKVNRSSYNVPETSLFRTQNSFKLTLENAGGTETLVYLFRQ